MSYYSFDRRLRMAHPIRLWFRDLCDEIKRTIRNAWRDAR